MNTPDRVVRPPSQRAALQTTNAERVERLISVSTPEPERFVDPCSTERTFQRAERLIGILNRLEANLGSRRDNRD